MKIVFLSLLMIVTSCSKFTERRPQIKNKPPGAADEVLNPSTPGTTPSPSVTPVPNPGGGGDPAKDPSEQAQTDPIDDYLSVGSYLEAEFKKNDNSGKIVKVYAQIRQENNLAKNLDDLKAALAASSSNLAFAADEARKLNVTNVEFEVDINALKSSLTAINKPLSSIEISGLSLPAK